MALKKEILDEVKVKVQKLFKEVFDDYTFKTKLRSEIKNDQTIVTRIDKEISSIIKDTFKGYLENDGYHFFSEEDKESFSFPGIILDPIDGTREMAQGIGECVISLALCDTEDSGFGWLYNPFTGFEISTDDIFHNPLTIVQDDLLGLISRTEYSKGEIREKEFRNLRVAPKGSIAFKLGLLAAGSCDFVYSKSPKNIWDIAAGVLICRTRGIETYVDGKKMESLKQLKIPGNILWCRPSLKQIIEANLG